MRGLEFPSASFYDLEHCTHTHTYLNTCRDMRVCVNIQICIYACIDVCRHKYTCIHGGVCMNVCKHKYIHTYLCIYTCRHTRTYISIHMHTRISECMAEHEKMCIHINLPQDSGIVGGWHLLRHGWHGWVMSHILMRHVTGTDETYHDSRKL